MDAVAVHDDGTPTGKASLEYGSGFAQRWTGHGIRMCRAASDRETDGRDEHRDEQSLPHPH
jgi:hypothetical protein